MKLRLLADRNAGLVAERVDLEVSRVPDARARFAMVQAQRERDELRALNAAADGEG